MKKTMVIAIIVTFLISIIAVNFFGLSIKDFEGYKYVERIEYELTLKRETDATIGEMQAPAGDTRAWYKFNFQSGSYTMENLTDNPNAVFINCHAYPDDAKNKRINLRYDQAQAEGLCVIDQATMTVYFLKKGAITITLEPADKGKAPKKEIFIVAR